MLSRADALTAFLWVVVCAGSMLFLTDLMSAGFFFSFVLIVTVFDPAAGIRKILRHAKVLLLLPVVLFMFHLVLQPGPEIGGWGPLRISGNGLRVGGLMALRVATVTLASFAFIWAADFRELLAGLVRFGMPYELAFTVFFGLRYIPVMENERRNIVDAIGVRRQGKPVGPKASGFLLVRYLVTLIVAAVLKAQQAATALQVRGFGAYGIRTFLYPHSFQPSGLVLLLLTIVLASILIAVQTRVS